MQFVLHTVDGSKIRLASWYGESTIIYRGFSTIPDGWMILMLFFQEEKHIKFNQPITLMINTFWRKKTNKPDKPESPKLYHTYKCRWISILSIHWNHIKPSESPYLHQQSLQPLNHLPNERRIGVARVLHLLLMHRSPLRCPPGYPFRNPTWWNALFTEALYLGRFDATKIDFQFQSATPVRPCHMMTLHSISLPSFSTSFGWRGCHCCQHYGNSCPPTNRLKTWLR